MLVIPKSLSGGTGCINNHIAFFHKTLFSQTILDIFNCMIGTDKFIIIKALYTPQQIKRVQ